MTQEQNSGTATDQVLDVGSTEHARRDSLQEGLMISTDAIIIGTMLPRPNGEAVARWVYEVARQREDTGRTLVKPARPSRSCRKGERT